MGLGLGAGYITYSTAAGVFSVVAVPSATIVSSLYWGVGCLGSIGTGYGACVSTGVTALLGTTGAVVGTAAIMAGAGVGVATGLVLYNGFQLLTKRRLTKRSLDDSRISIPPGQDRGSLQRVGNAVYAIPHNLAGAIPLLNEVLSLFKGGRFTAQDLEDVSRYRAHLGQVDYDRKWLDQTEYVDNLLSSTIEEDPELNSFQDEINNNDRLIIEHTDSVKSLWNLLVKRTEGQGQQIDELTERAMHDVFSGLQALPSTGRNYMSVEGSRGRRGSRGSRRALRWIVANGNSGDDDDESEELNTNDEGSARKSPRRSVRKGKAPRRKRRSSDGGGVNKKKTKKNKRKLV